MLKEFKEFAMRGNVVDMAIGVIIGGAFGKIVSSLVNEVLMPVIGMLTGGIDLTSLTMTVGSANVKYGVFLQTVLDFLIVAFVIFLFINYAMKKKKETGAAPPAPPKQEVLLEEIRDILKKQS